MAIKKFYNDVEVKGALTIPGGNVQTQIDAKIDSSEKGTAGGVATLDGAGKVPSAQLPSYVDDVLEYANLAAFPATGATGLIYVALDTNKCYRWSGSAYVEISPSEVTSVYGRTGAVTAQSGDYTASQVTNTPAGTIAATTVQAAIDELDSDVQAVQTNLTNHISDATDAHAASAITNTPAGNLAATTVQAALNELQSDIDTRALSSDLTAHISDATDAHDASAISYDNTTSGLTATTAQAAIDELAAQPTGSPGDIEQTSFSITNNQSTPADVTGLIFSPASVRGFEVLATAHIDATSDLFETFKIYGIQRGADFQISVESVGDVSGLEFTITSLGQIQYTSTNVAGFLSGVLKFRAIVTNV